MYCHTQCGVLNHDRCVFERKMNKCQCETPDFSRVVWIFVEDPSFSQQTLKLFYFCYGIQFVCLVETGKMVCLCLDLRSCWQQAELLSVSVTQVKCGIRLQVLQHKGTHVSFLVENSLKTPYSLYFGSTFYEQGTKQGSTVPPQRISEQVYYQPQEIELNIIRTFYFIGNLQMLQPC